MQPFLGFATYFAPLCYVFRDRTSLYSVSRALYCRLWCKLNVFSSDPDTLLTVCRTFEELLLQSHSALFLHLVAIGFQPLKVWCWVTPRSIQTSQSPFHLSCRWLSRGSNSASRVCWRWTSYCICGTGSSVSITPHTDRSPGAVSHTGMSPGYMDPLLLAVAAAAIFLHRADALMRVICSSICCR